MNTPREPQQQSRSNLRLGLVLASVVLMFFAGFVAKIVLFGR